MTADAEIFVGSRIEYEGFHGTVLYVGEVAPFKGIWLGVEWDNPSRGKHDGCSKEGHRYFTTSHPTSGSFIRPKMANTGLPMMQEVSERYGLVEDEHGGIIQEEMYVRGKGQQTVVQVVGASSVNAKQSHFDLLLEVGLRNTGVNGAGMDGEIAQSLPSVEDLDISLTLISSWEEVARITRQLPKLNILNVSDNRLKMPETPESLQEIFQSVKTLYLNRMQYTWSQVLQCCGMFPSLQKLHVCFNSISSITELHPHLSNLRLLNLESNPIKDWNHILQLGSLSKLEMLILNDTQIDKVSFPDVDHGETTASFPNLTAISLSNNSISQWNSIDELNKLQSLTELTFRKNPVLGTNEYADRYVIIAKLGKLQLHNRSDIESADRKGAEVDYLKLHGQAWRSAGGHQDSAKSQPSREFTQAHPRYQLLIEKYGPPEDSELKVHSSALKNSLISLQIDSPMLPDKAPLKKKLPVSMTVQKLKALLQRLYKVDPMNMTLTYSSLKMPDQEIEFESDQREIGFYSIEEGDCVHVKW